MNRRDFLKRAILGVAAVATLGPQVLLKRTEVPLYAGRALTLQMMQDVVKRVMHGQNYGMSYIVCSRETKEAYERLLVGA